MTKPAAPRPDNEPDQVRIATVAALNRNGHAFQDAAVRAIRDESVRQNLGWTLEVTEFPVSTNNKSTRVDAVFVRGQGFQKDLLVVECKRVNPNMGRWCFAKPSGDSIVRGESLRFGAHRFQRADGALMEGGTLLVAAAGIPPRTAERSYCLSFELKNPTEKGESGRSDRAAVDDACHQICLGTNGLIEYFSRLYCKNDQFVFGMNIFSVLVTTADLFVCDGDLAESEISTGNVVESSLNIKPVPSVLFQYHQDAQLLHSLSPLSPSARKTHAAVPRETHSSSFGFSALGSDLIAHYRRTIRIVNARAIDKTIGSWT